MKICVHVNLCVHAVWLQMHVSWEIYKRLGHVLLTTVVGSIHLHKSLPMPYHTLTRTLSFSYIPSYVYRHVSVLQILLKNMNAT